ncbi:MAG: c-type cytochrome [Campylobacterota bacterium]|nr:c-type cytochrome [Campylobacterota bacterium]
MGEEIYMKTCVSCHGVDGKAETDMQFVVRPRSLQASILNEEQNYKIIKKGTHYWGAAADIMPSFESVLEDEELHAVAHYISKKFNPNAQSRVKELYAKSDSVPENKLSKMHKRGAKIYKRNCSWCHGLDAKGDGEATRNPEKSIYPYNLAKTLLTNEQMFLYTKYGGKFWGTDKNDMPSWSRKYDDYTLKSVVLYIDETFRK